MNKTKQFNKQLIQIVKQYKDLLSKKYLSYGASLAQRHKDYLMAERYYNVILKQKNKPSSRAGFIR